MSATTMLDVVGLTFLEGDPLGLRELEESLVWRTNGPLPDWLDDAEPEEDLETSPVSLPQFVLPPVAVETPAPPVASEPLPAELVEKAPPASAPLLVALDAPSPAIELPPPEPLCAAFVEMPAEGLISIDQIVGMIEAPPAQRHPPESAEPPVLPVPARRLLAPAELVDARLCLLAAVGGQLWAVSLERVAQVNGDVDNGVDLFERFEGKKRRDHGVAIVFDSDAKIIVDRILGPRSIGWQNAVADAPEWMLAQAHFGGEPVGLLDWEYFCGASW